MNMNKKKAVYVVYNSMPELNCLAGRSYTQALHTNELGALPPMLKAGDKVIVYDICTAFPVLDFMLNFFEFAGKNGVTFESIRQGYLNFSPSRPLPYKITNYLLEMQTFRNQLWNTRRQHGITTDNTPQAREYLRQCDLIAKHAISIALATGGILKK